MKILLLAALALLAAGCANSDHPARPHHARHHHRHRSAGGTETAEAESVPPPGPASPETGAANAALGRSARDSQGHPAITDY